MHDVINVETKYNKANKPNERNRRFMWHEQVIRDPLLPPTAYRYAGLVMHDYYLNRNGYSIISVRNATDMLGVSPSSIQTARNALVSRGWLKRVEGTGQHTARYEIAFANPNFRARSLRLGVPSEDAQDCTP
jgi:hypothetical protein